MKQTRTRTLRRLVSAPLLLALLLAGVTGAPAQEAGRLALRHSADMEQRVSTIVSERERLTAGLGDLPVETWPSEANFVLFRPRDRTGDDVWNALVERSVLVRNCSSWPRLTNCLRVTVGTPEENGRFLAALGEVLA